MNSLDTRLGRRGLAVDKYILLASLDERIRCMTVDASGHLLTGGEEWDRRCGGESANFARIRALSSCVNSVDTFVTISVTIQARLPTTFTHCI